MAPLVLLKACPKCVTGDLIRVEDIYGFFWNCLQCGHINDLPLGLEHLFDLTEH